MKDEQTVVSQAKKRLLERIADVNELERLRYILQETASVIMDVQSADDDNEIASNMLNRRIDRLLGLGGE